MNEELTDELLEAMKKCDGACFKCLAKEYCAKAHITSSRQELAAALLEERAKPKVWDGAPEWATNGRVYWTNGFDKEMYSKLYTRELPKTRARQIAEQEGYRLAEIHGWNAAGKELVTNAMESAINKYAEELEGKE